PLPRVAYVCGDAAVARANPIASHESSTRRPGSGNEKPPCVSKGEGRSLPFPYLADRSAGIGTLRFRRLPGFTGPSPSTSRDKASIRLLITNVTTSSQRVKSELRDREPQNTMSRGEVPRLKSSVSLWNCCPASLAGSTVAVLTASRFAQRFDSRRTRD